MMAGRYYSEQDFLPIHPLDCIYPLPAERKPKIVVSESNQMVFYGELGDQLLYTEQLWPAAPGCIKIKVGKESADWYGIVSLAEVHKPEQFALHAMVEVLARRREHQELAPVETLNR